ncbi:hypothetical protein [Nocardia bovistercoris]|uniref:Uncharacterized protein n=1 Tax=Nocardia bovistercoris TaxID=2785916 RepID=A0A931I8U7_9NOCA|nr:hypothetical protein [Nocardia bovistercoris]MBH0776814.1 hypothetical protein [Nocardia bovistercoris]
MGVLDIVLLVAAIVVVVLTVVVIVARVALGKARRSAQETIAATFAPGEALRTDPMANFFGLASKAGLQIRGNGPLVLTGTRLWFQRIGSDAPLEISLASVTDVDLVRSHAGKTVSRDLLRVTFDGDSAAWYVREPAAWRDRILTGRPEFH